MSKYKDIKAASQAPWFMFWVKEWLTDERLAHQPAEVRGALITLRAWAWLADDPCTLPTDDKQLAVMSGLGRRWKKFGPTVLRFFTRRDDKRLVDTALLELYTYMKTNTVEKSTRARHAAEARWATRQDPM